MLGSKHAFHETIKKIEAAATDVSLSVERMKNLKVQILLSQHQSTFATQLLQVGIHILYNLIKEKKKKLF